AHIESAVVPGNGCRHNMSFGGRDIDHAADSAPGGDAVELAVVGFDGIQVVADGDHAVPCAIGFEVGRVGIRYGVGLLEGAEVRDLRPAMVGIYTDYTVRDAGDAMRTAGAGQDTIEGIADEGDVGDAGDQGALCRGGLAGGQVIDPGRPYAAGANTGDARSGVAAGIRSYGREDICAGGGVGPAEARFGDIEIAVGAEQQAARTVEPPREYASGGDIVAGTAIAHA